MDRLGVDYVERPAGGALGAFFLGRTVPQLKVRTGAVQSVIGNSAEILRYLWGRYEVDDPARAAFLRPTKERIDLESRLDQYGVSLQVWVYYHVLHDRELTLRAWGAEDPATPIWQRYLLRVLFPVLRVLIRRSFRITEANYQKSVSRIEALLGEANGWLARRSPVIAERRGAQLHGPGVCRDVGALDDVPTIRRRAGRSGSHRVAKSAASHARGCRAVE